MDKKKWEYIEHEVMGGAMVKLDCDGYKVMFGLIRISMCRFSLRVLFVNGTFGPNWAIEDCEERRRFLYPNKVFVWSHGIRSRCKKVSKRALKSMKINPDEREIRWSYRFPSFTALRRHFEANNKSIEIVSPCYSEELASA